MFTINSKGTSQLTKQEVRANKPTKEINGTIKNIQLILKKKGTRRKKRRRKKRQIENKEQDGRYKTKHIHLPCKCSKHFN